MGVLEGLLAPKPKAQKAESGVGAAMVRHGTPLMSFSDSPQKRAATALAAGKSNIHIRAAERTIASRISTTPWWLESGDGRITDESPEAERAILDLFEHPYRPQPGDPQLGSPQTFGDLRNITIRHSGLVGYAFWYLVGIEALAGTPAEILYINPTRLTPDLDKQGRLTGWLLDADPMQRGVRFGTEEIVVFGLEPPDEGHLPDGLVASALAKAEIARLGDQHSAFILSAGGRMPGIFHPPANGAIPEEQYQGIVRDLRSIVEMPDAAKRSMVLKGPIEFDQHSMTPSDMALLELMAMSRDDILGLWGMPASQLGYQRPVGIGELSEDKDAQVMWSNAIGPRLRGFAETWQVKVLDRYADLGLDITAHFDEPEFDDKATLFDMAQAAVNQPLRNVERRELVGLAPFGDARDDEVWLPINMVSAYQATPFDPGDMGKARLASDQQVVRLKDALATFLQEQAARIGARIERNASHIASKPNDIDVWWKESEEDELLQKVLAPHLLSFADAGANRAIRRVRGKAADDSIFRDVLASLTLQRIADRVTNINRTARDRIREMIALALTEETPPSEVGRALRGVVDPLESDTVGRSLRERLGRFGSELRAETIARTEMRVAQNGASIDAYSAEGIQNVEMLDGDQDPECAARDGRIVSVQEAERHMAEEHPNGTLDFAPVISSEDVGKALSFRASHDGGPIHDPSYQGGGPVPYAPMVQHIHYPQPEFKVEMPVIEIPATEVHVPKPDPVNVEVHTPAPVVNVAAAEAPIVNVAAPEVQVDAPPVDVTPIAEAVRAGAEQQAKASAAVQPVHVVNMPKPRKAKVKRDPVTGQITEVVQEDA